MSILDSSKTRKRKEEEKRLAQEQIDRQAIQEGADRVKAGQDAEAASFRRLAEQRLGDERQFLNSERAQEELLRRRVSGETIAAQRAQAGQFASQGIRGGAAVAARAAQANQGAQMQGDVARQLIQGRGERQQALRQQLLAAELAGKQFGGSQQQQLISSFLNRSASREAAEAQKGTYLCSLACYKGDISLDVLALDAKYGLELVNPYTRFGYDAWAPTIRDMAFNNELVYSIVKPFVVAWAEHISGKRPSIFGALVKGIGEPVCYVIGRARAFLKGIK